MTMRVEEVIVLSITETSNRRTVRYLYRIFEYTPDFIVFIYSLIDGYLHVKLGDFGLAKSDDDTSMTYVGCREYLAPVSSNRSWHIK